MQPFLIFDAYGTLAELDDFAGRSQRGFAQRGVELPLDVVARAARCEMRHYVTHTVRARTQEDWLALRHECSVVLAESFCRQNFPLALPPELIYDIMSDALAFRAFPEVITVLEALRQKGLAMAVLSNWDIFLPDVLQSLGLLHFFAFILTSAEIGVQKPAPRIFECALQRARVLHPGLAASGCYYIGDHYEGDVLGARAAGMTPFWLVRDERDLVSGGTHAGGDDVARLSTLRDLLEII
ncbi:MAG TPA: HAD-IA family hydrolase [Abditibacteriaceae bacterium]|nr:HAD-IA family hydrolase [Abditibacteriaceae bacterium]